ncbi:hypothetical protein D3C85_1719520 [compost metagenome]
MVTTDTMAPIFIRVLDSSGFFFAQSPSFSDISPIHWVMALISGLIASPKLTMALVKVPVAASHKLPRVPSWALTRSCRAAWSAIFFWVAR